MKTMESIYDVSVNTNAGSDFYLLLGDFLDEFYRAAPELRAEIMDEKDILALR